MLKKIIKIEGTVHFGFNWTTGYEEGKKVQHYLSINCLRNLYQLIQKNRANQQFKMFKKNQPNRNGYELLKKQIIQLHDIKHALLDHEFSVPIIESK